jgi:hypothetical protein
MNTVGKMDKNVDTILNGGRMEIKNMKQLTTRHLKQMG